MSGFNSGGMRRFAVLALLLLLGSSSQWGLSEIGPQAIMDGFEGEPWFTDHYNEDVANDEMQAAMLLLQTDYDNDGDGVANAHDDDDDNDCVLDVDDSEPSDFDEDGIYDYEDDDDDGDGVLDTEEVSDSNAMTNIYDADNDGAHDCSFVTHWLDVEWVLSGSEWLVGTIVSEPLVVGAQYHLGYVVNETESGSTVHHGWQQTPSGWAAPTWVAEENSSTNSTSPFSILENGLTAGYEYCIDVWLRTGSSVYEASVTVAVAHACLTLPSNVSPAEPVVLATGTNLADTSILIHPNTGAVHIAYSGQEGVMHVTNESGSWAHTVVDSNGAERMDMVVASNGTLYVTYSTHSETTGLYGLATAASEDNGATWVTQSLIANANVWTVASALNDASGELMISYGHWEEADLEIIVIDTNDWASGEVYGEYGWGSGLGPLADGTASSPAGQYTDVVVDAEGVWYVGYTNGSSLSFAVGVWNSNHDAIVWDHVLLDTTFPSGEGVSMGLTMADQIQMAYRAGSNEQTALRTGVWDIESQAFYVLDDVEYVGHNGYDGALAVTPGSLSQIAYFYEPSPSLRMAHNATTDGGWVNFLIDGDDSILAGYGPSIAIDEDGRCHIAYLAQAAQNVLKYYHCDAFDTPAPEDSETECAGDDAYPTGSEYIMVNPHPDYGQSINSGEELRAVVTVGGLSASGDCGATYEIRTMITRTMATGGGPGAATFFLAYPSNDGSAVTTPSPYTAVCMGISTCSFEIASMRPDGCYSIYIGLYIYPPEDGETLGERLDHSNDYENLWVVGGVDCETGEPPSEEPEPFCDSITVVTSPQPLVEGGVLNFTWVVVGNVGSDVWFSFYSNLGDPVVHAEGYTENDGEHSIPLAFGLQPNVHHLLYVSTVDPVCWTVVEVFIESDMDDDGIPDSEDEDDDNDGWVDAVEDVCESDALSAASIPSDQNENGICDVVENAIEDVLEPSDGVCSAGAIAGGILGNAGFQTVRVTELTGGAFNYEFAAHGSTSRLLKIDGTIEGLVTERDIRGYNEYYDLYVSNEDGEFDPQGGYITIMAYVNLQTEDFGVGHNIDAVSLVTSDGSVMYASEVVRVVLGEGLHHSDLLDGGQSNILGAPDMVPTYLGNNMSSITVGFCNNAVEDEGGAAGSLPAPGVMATLVLLLGAAVVARTSVPVVENRHARTRFKD